MVTQARRHLAPAAAVLVMAVALVSCGDDSPAPAPAGHGAQSHPTAALPSPDVETGVVHVHGLGVEPADDLLYAATHSGVFAISKTGSAVRVANRVQDTMGFSVVGPRTFIASGHPDPREDDVRPPLLGLIESTDAGRTWKRLSLHGEADFHALHAAHGAVYGYDATSSTFMVSVDRVTWDRRSQVPMRDFAVDPADRDHVVATTARGPLVSRDGGRSWSALPGAPPVVVLAWHPRAGLFGVAGDGSVYRSADAAASWVRSGSAGGAPEAMTLHLRGRTATLYVAVRGVGIVASRDAGRSFTTRYRQKSG